MAGALRFAGAFLAALRFAGAFFFAALRFAGALRFAALRFAGAFFAALRFAGAFSWLPPSACSCFAGGIATTFLGVVGEADSDRDDARSPETPRLTVTGVETLVRSFTAIVVCTCCS